MQQTVESDGELITFRHQAGDRVIGIRGSVIVTSRKILHARGHGEAYRNLLPPEAEEQFSLLTPSQWVPNDLSIKHYEACNALDLSDTECRNIGVETAQRVMGSFARTLIRAATHIGVTPWVALRRYGKLWSHSFRGGVITVRKTGSKQADVRITGCEMFDFNYFALAYTATVESTVALFGRGVSVRLSRKDNAARLLVTWQ